MNLTTTKRTGSILLLIAILSVIVPSMLHADIDVLFSDDFENLDAGDTPADFLPTGLASPDWDNAVFNPDAISVLQNQIDAGSIGSPANATNKYRMEIGANGKPLLLGANFSPSSDRFVVIEYDMLLTVAGINRPAAEIYYADGYSDLDGNDASTKIAIKVTFNKKSGPADRLYYTTGQDNDLSGGTEILFDPTIPWAANIWYRIQVVADQETKKFDIKVTDLSDGSTIEDQDLDFNTNGAGYIRKIWFGMESSATEMYLDNVIIYQNVVSPPPTGPVVILNEFSIGPVSSNADAGMDIDFSDDTDLESMQYKIGTGGSWKNLIETRSTTTPFDLTGGADTSKTADDVYLSDADFAGLSDGETRIYFKATDNDAIKTESAGYVVLTKDTNIPSTATVTVPDSSTVEPPLASLQGSVADEVSGVVTNSATLTLRRQDTSQYWNGSGWQAGLFALPTTHAATSDGTAATWTSNFTTPVAGTDIDNNVNMTAQVSVDDSLGNGVLIGTPLTFALSTGYPEITLNLSKVDPVSTNTAAGMDVDFSGNGDDLTSIQYKIDAGSWNNLTTNGTTTVNASLPLAAWTDPVFISNTDFGTMADGDHNIYFRAVDDGTPVATSATVSPVVFTKDTTVPSVASVTAPSTHFGELAMVIGQISDGSSGSGLDANTATFSIERDDGQYWDGQDWDSATRVDLPTAHSAAVGGTSVNWFKNAYLPGPSDLDAESYYTFAVIATDRAGNTYTDPVTYQHTDNPKLDAGSSVMASDNSYVKLVFSESVWGDSGKTTAIVPGDFTANFQHNGGDVTAASISDLWADSGLAISLSAVAGYSVVFAELNNTGGTASGVETITITANADSIYDNSALAMANTESTGALTYQTVPAGPTISSVTADDPDDIDGVYGNGDTITVVFSEDTNEPAAASQTDIDAIFSFSQSLGADYTGIWSGADTLRITIVDATGATPPTIGSLTLTFQGSNGLKNLLATSADSTGSSGTIGGDWGAPSPPTVSSVVTGDADGDGQIDRLTINFDKNVDIADGSAGDGFPQVTFGSYTIENSDYVAAAATSLVLTLAESGSADTGDTPNVTFTNDGDVTDSATSVDAVTYGPAAVTDGAGPAIKSARTATTTTVEVTFSEAVSDASVAGSDFTFSGFSTPGANAAGIGFATGGGANDSVAIVTLAATIGPEETGNVALSAGAVTESAVTANISTQTAAVSVDDGTAPTLVSVALTDTPNQGAAVGDTMTFVFDEALSATSITDALIGGANHSLAAGTGDITATLANLIAELGSFANPAAATDSDAVLTLSGDGTTVTISLAGTVVDGTFPGGAFTPASTYTDTAGNVVDTGATPSATGTWDGIAPSITGRDTADLDGDGYLDAIHITFDENVDDSTVTAGDFDVAGVTGESFSATTNGDTADDADIYITFVAGTVHATDQVPTIGYTQGTLTDLPGNLLATSAATATTDTTGPAILSAVASDASSAAAGIDNDDTVTITFSEATNQPGIASGTIDGILDLSGGHVWVDGAGGITGAVWNDASTLVITLSDSTSDPTIAIGDTITLDGSTIDDGAANNSTTAASPLMIGTFSPDVAAPSISGRETADTDGDGYLDAIHLTFDEPVLDSTVTAGDFDVETVTGESFASTTAGDVANDSDIYITFTAGTTFPTDQLPTISYTQGTLTDLSGNFLATSTATSTTDKAGATIWSVTSADGDGTYAAGAGIDVTVNFSEAVTLAGGTLDVALDSGGSASIAPFGSASSANATYTVLATENSPDLAATTPLTLGGGGTLVDAAGNATSLTIPSGQNIADAKAIVVDTTAPTITSVTSSSGDGTYGIGADINVTVNFSETVTLSGGNLQVALDSGGTVSMVAFGPATSASVL
jgi:hypothetical protein